MARFRFGMGGKTWGNIATQYYQSNLQRNYSDDRKPAAAVGGRVARQHQPHSRQSEPHRPSERSSTSGAILSRDHLGRFPIS